MVKRKATKQGGRARKRQRVVAKRPVRMGPMTTYAMARKFIWSPVSGSPGIISSATSPNVTGGFSFAFTDIPSQSDFTNLFDQFRIVKVNITLVPGTNTIGFTNGPISSSQNIGAYTNMFHYVYDYSDASGPLTANKVLEVQGARSVNLSEGKTFRMSLVPRMKQVAQTTTGIVNAGRQWMSTELGKSEPHFGVKYFWECDIPAPQKIAVYMEYVCEFRGVN